MDKGIYTALSGGLAKGREIELIANNLANANTPGFKRDTGTFNEYLTELRRNDTVEGLQRDITSAALMDGRPTGDKSFVEMDGVYTDHRQGSLERSGRPLDFALQGKGFFEVLTSAGVRYTRQGNFSINAEGTLVTASGHPVLRRITADELTPQGGKVPNIPPEARTIRLQKGQITVTEEGRIFQESRPVARLTIQEFKDSQWLEKSGNAYYKNMKVENLDQQSTGQTRVEQGFIETSNVNPVREMTRLIEATRAYESHMQAVRTYQEIDGKSVNDIAIQR